MITISPGGFLKSVEDDSSPQLSGDLDGQSTHSLVNMVDGTFSGVGTFGSLAVAHADTHQFGDSDPIDHDLLANWGPNEHIDWTSTDEDLLTTGSGTFGALVVDTDTLVVDAVNHRTGFGTDTPTEFLHLIKPSEANVREVLAKFAVSDASGDLFAFTNLTNTDGVFSPQFLGAVETGSIRSALAFTAECNASNDTGTEPMLVFNARKYTDGEDFHNPASGFSDIGTRPLLAFRNRATIKLLMDKTGNIELDGSFKVVDNAKGFQLMSNSASIRYGLKYGNAGSLGGSDNLALTNREDDGDLRFQTSPGGGAGNEVDRMVIDGETGNVSIGPQTPTALLDINSDILRLRTAKTPATAGAAGNQGDICWDASYIYACVAASTWKRAALATW